MNILRKKGNSAVNMRFGWKKEINHEKGLSSFFVILILGLMLFASKQGFETVTDIPSVTGYVVSGSSGYADKESFDIQIRSQIKNEIETLDSTHLSGLSSGTITTGEGTTSYQQYIKIADYFSGQNIQSQIKIDYGLSQGNSPNYVGDFMFLKNPQVKDPKNAFMEYGINFVNGLKSSYANGELGDLLGKKITIVGNEYEIVSAELNLNNKRIGLSLFDSIIDANLKEGQTMSYLLDSRDYNVQVLDVPNAIIKDSSLNPVDAVLNITGGDITNEVVNVVGGETHYLSNGVPFMVVDVDLNETPVSGYLDGDNGLLGEVYDIAFTLDGYLVIADTENNAIRLLVNDHLITIAGSEEGDVDGSGSNARFNSPKGIATSKFYSNIIYVADTGNNKIKKIEMVWNGNDYVSSNVVTIAGTGAYGGVGGGTGDTATFSAPEGIVATHGSSEILYVADTGMGNNNQGNSIRKIYSNFTSNATANLTTWIVSTFAGGSFGGCAEGQGISARFRDPTDLVLDNVGNIYVADYGNNVIKKIDGMGLVSNFAGVCGANGYVDGDNARFYRPYGIAVDSKNNLYVTEVGNDVIRKVNVTNVSTFVGSGDVGFVDGESLLTKLNNPRGIDIMFNVMYFADANNYKIRKTHDIVGSSDLPSQLVTTVLGPIPTGDVVNIAFGGTVLGLEDINYENDEETDSNFLGYSNGFSVNDVDMSETFVRFLVNDSDLDSVKIDSLSYRVAPNTASVLGMWINKSFGLSDYLSNPEVLPGSFDVVYDGLQNVAAYGVIVTANVADNAYNLTYLNKEGSYYSFPYVSNEQSLFKYGSLENDLVFVEGSINTSGSINGQDYTVGVGDYFILNNLQENNTNLDVATSFIIKYVGINVTDSTLKFVNIGNGNTAVTTVTYNNVNINGVLGKASYVIGGNTYDVYIANLSDNSLGINPLAIDQNKDGNVDGSEIVLVDLNNAIFDLGVASKGGAWTQVDGHSGSWSNIGGSISGVDSTLKLISSYEQFGYSTFEQNYPEVCEITDGITCDSVILTEDDVQVTIHNNLDYLAFVEVEVEGCTADMPIVPSFSNGTSLIFTFSDCSGQKIVGENIDKTVTLKYLKGTTPNQFVVSYAGNLISHVSGSPLVCLEETSDVVISKKSGIKIGIDPESISGSCGLQMYNVPGTNKYLGMSSYGVLFNLTAETSGIGSELRIEHSVEQVKGTISFVTGSDNSCQPESFNEACSGFVCGQVSDGCGGLITCGTCNSNENCINNLCVPNTCVPNTCSDLGYDCGSISDGCGNTLNCGSCAGDEVCSSNVCVEECDTNSDCNSGEVCSSGLCVLDGNVDTYYFDLDVDNTEDFDLAEGDVVVVEGLDDDYNLELNRVYNDGKIKFKVIDPLPQFSIVISDVGDTVNIDLDNDDEIDINIRSLSFDEDDKEVSVRFKKGEYSSIGGNEEDLGGNSGGYCGDGVCSSGESVFTCPDDCGSGIRTSSGGRVTVGGGVNTGSNFDTVGESLGGSVVIEQKKTNLILWVILGVLIGLVIVMVVLVTKKPKGLVKKPIKPFNGNSIQSKNSNFRKDFRRPIDGFDKSSNQW